MSAQSDARGLAQWRCLLSAFTKISCAKTEDPPTEPVVRCLGCSKDFVWWVHPVQLCDDCVAREFSKVEIPEVL